ncbi:glutathione synthase [Pseudenhygromyxa sp. WMMC2535]|uniref:glutathione synthase n=1 Tax=Pseudenhygromyxa sp. WMMC2535 TaxID=2712867 RepID=UPI0015543239|nr:glutathione synthase [Pseudenhygromyxa sp. WMMC2535]NVB37386.1 glutathione synthase [Pseudenhygromyxa sp. WMMC2535]
MADVLFVLDPLDRIDPRADSSYVMVTEALRRGHSPWYATVADLALLGSEAWAHTRPLAVEGAEIGAPLIDGGAPRLRRITDFDVVLMRKDPPVDEAFVTATWVLDRAKSQTLVLNDPASLRSFNEKLSMLEFPELIPQTRMLRREADLRRALDDMGGKMILKPVLGYGGRGVMLLSEGDPNTSTLLELATGEGAHWTMAQQFLPAAKIGDKRILLVEGEVIGAVLRVPADGELRDNFHTGGSPHGTQLSPRDLEICAAVGPWLRERGLFFAGIDVIGEYLTEINVTSPTGMQEVNHLGGLEGDETTQAKFWAAIERKLART